MAAGVATLTLENSLASTCVGTLAQSLPEKSDGLCIVMPDYDDKGDGYDGSKDEDKDYNDNDDSGDDEGEEAEGEEEKEVEGKGRGEEQGGGGEEQDGGRGEEWGEGRVLGEARGGDDLV